MNETPPSTSRTRRTRLLVVSHSCATAVNQQLYAEVERLSGWDISLVVPSNWRDEYGRVCEVERWPTFQGEIIPVRVRQSGNIILHSYATSFAKLIGRVSPDAIYINHEPYSVASAQVYWANARTGRRPIGCYSCQNIFKQYPPPFRWTESRVLASSSFFFPISRAVDDVFRRKGYTGQSTVLPFAIDEAVHHPRDATALRRKLLGESSQDVLLGYVGRLVAPKGLLTLVDALALIRELPWRMVLAGSGELEGELRRRLAASGIADRVTFAGFIPHTEVPTLFSAMDVLVLPSETQPNWREQFGRVLLEAMACGTPVIGSSSGEIPTLVHDTGGGLVFEERSAASLAEAMRQLITDPDRRRKLAENGAAAVAARYSIAHAASAFAEAVGRALRPTASNPESAAFQHA